MSSTTRRLLLTAFGLALAPLPALAADAASFPGKPVRIINPFPVGGGPDGVARLLADKLSRTWGQPVTVENRPGGNGFIAIDAWKRGAKDGTDLLILDTSHLAVYPSLMKHVPYDPVKDFDALLPLFKTYFFFTVAANSKYNSVADIIADAKANPGKLNYGSWSVGNPVHLGSVMFENLTATNMEHVIFKETSQLYASVATGELHWALGSAATAGPMYHAGKIKLLAVTSPKRLATFPDIPTVRESGGPKNFEISGWNAVAVPPGLPAGVASKIRQDIVDALKSPEMTEKFKSFGYEPMPATRAEFSAYVKAESKRFGDVIRAANITLN
ncbi:MAG: tripartite tricarboxylate transporter substrate binding protein [Comamonas sp.]